MTCTAHVTADRVELWAPTQFQTEAVRVAARESGLAVDKVVLHTTLMGGGFGRRAESDFVVAAVTSFGSHVAQVAGDCRSGRCSG